MASTPVTHGSDFSMMDGLTPEMPQRVAPQQIHESSGLPHGHVPVYLPGSSSLVEELDKQVLVILRDGRHLVGRLCSYDQYSNLVMEDCVERRIEIDSRTGMAFYYDIPLGVYIVRGDTIVLLGNTDDEQLRMKRVSATELEELEQIPKTPLEWDFDNDLIA